MKTPTNRLAQEQRQASGDHTPTGLRLKTRRGSEEELVEISPAFRILQQHPIEQPSAAQWRDFSRSLAEKLDREAEKRSRFWSIQVLRDKLTATDSASLRAMGYIILAVALGAIAVGIWLMSTLALDAPAPQDSMIFTPAPITWSAPGQPNVVEFVRIEECKAA